MLTTGYAFLRFSAHIPKADSCNLAYSFRSVDTFKLHRSSHAAQNWAATWLRWQQGRRRYTGKHARHGDGLTRCVPMHYSAHRPTWGAVYCVRRIFTSALGMEGET